MSDELVDYEYALDEGNEEQKNNANGNKLMYTAIHAASFKDMLLKPELQRAIQDCGFEHPSEVQQECIPKAMIGVDILC